MYLHRSLHAFTVVSSNSTIEWQNQQWRPLNSFLILALARLLDPGLNLAPAHGRTKIMHTLLLPQPYCLHHSITAGSCGILSLQLRSSLFQLQLCSNLLVPFFFAVAFHLWFNTDWCSVAMEEKKCTEHVISFAFLALNCEDSVVRKRAAAHQKGGCSSWIPGIPKFMFIYWQGSQLLRPQVFFCNLKGELLLCTVPDHLIRVIPNCFLVVFFSIYVIFLP